jgi:hypothetical protein
MYKLTPIKVYMLDRVQDDPRCVTRMERILSAINLDSKDVVCITEDNLPEVATELRNLWPPETVPEGYIRSYMRPLVFTTQELGHRRDLKPLLRKCPEGTPLSFLNNIYGYMTNAVDQHPHQRDQQDNCVCWPTFNFGTMIGCPHGCLYCGSGRGGKFLTIGLNLEDYMEKVVGPVIETYPWNKVFRMILNGADLMAFEPEYGLFDLFTRKLAQYEDRYGHFHTGGANVEWLADLPHKDRLVGVWSTTCDFVARNIEPGSGPAAERFKAGGKCQDMGIPARYKFKPIIPVVNWQEEYAKAIEQALTFSKPESIGFCMYIWNTYDSLVNTIPQEYLDPECLEAAREASDKMKGLRSGPFPHETRAEIYRFMINEVRKWDKDVLLYVSTETREIWNELKDELGQDPRTYICACSSVAVPGKRLSLSPGFKYSTYHPTPV